MSANTFANVPSATTDQVILAAVTNRRIRVFGVFCQAGGTATNITFNSKGGGAGTAISSTRQMAANGGSVLPMSADTTTPWFQTNVGEGLSATTNTGSTVGVEIIYDIYAPPGVN